jgi:predicted metal-binding protein
MSKPPTIAATPTPWRDIILVCRKCTRRLGGGFGKKHREPLRSELKTALRASGHRRDARVIEIGCLGLCPKGAVTVVIASRPGELLAIPKGMDVRDLLVRLSPISDQSDS